MDENGVEAEHVVGGGGSSRPQACSGGGRPGESIGMPVRVRRLSPAKGAPRPCGAEVDDAGAVHGDEHLGRLEVTVDQVRPGDRGAQAGPGKAPAATQATAACGAASSTSAVRT